MGWVRRLRSTFSGTERDFDEERRFHIDERTDEYVRERNGPGRGSPGGAQALRQRDAGDRADADVDMFRWIDDLGRDTRYALRMLRRSPGFSLLAILCLTLGIGANAAVFSWIEGILLRPYPLVVDQDRLFAVTGTNRGAAGPHRRVVARLARSAAEQHAGRGVHRREDHRHHAQRRRSRRARVRQHGLGELLRRDRRASRCWAAASSRARTPGATLIR